jgi:hypothetical protein
MGTITVYKSYGMSDVLDQLEIDEDDTCLEIEPIQKDSRDGSDWWIDFLDEVEEQFGDSWVFVKFSSDYEDINRLISRQYYLGNDEIEWSQFFVPTAILISKEKVENFNSIFSNQKFTENNLDRSLLVKFQMPFSSPDLVKQIMEFEFFKNNCESIPSLYQNRKYWYEVIQPEANSLFAAKLSGSFEAIVNFKNVNSVNYFTKEIHKLHKLHNAQKCIEYILQDLHFFDIQSNALVNSTDAITLEVNELLQNIFQDYFNCY